MNKKAKLVPIGEWNWKVDAADNFFPINFYDLAQLDTSGKYSIVVAGWAYAGWQNTKLYKVNIVIVDQDEKGNLKINTKKYINDPVINGAGSVIAHDFNGDGIDDLFLAAHNESPNAPTSSTVYLSKASGGFQKIQLEDSTQSHSAILGDLHGVPTVSTAGYGPNDPYYQYNSNTNAFDIKYWGNYRAPFYSSSSVLVDLNQDGKSELVIGDFKNGPGIPNDPNRVAGIGIYQLDNSALGASPVSQLNPYFNTDKYRGQGLVSEWGDSLSHIYRAWTDDFNYDDKPDLLFGVGIWNSGNFSKRAKLQMLQNEGNFKFLDVTDAFGSGFSENSLAVDYSMQMMDIDGSGIKSYLMAVNPDESDTLQANYLFVNDGSGRLYPALHKEFNGYGGKFIPYLRQDGLVSYMYFYDQFYHYDLQYDVKKDFTDNIEILDRNQSQRLRTFAGNDVIHDINRSGQMTHIDGGLGLDTVVYSGMSNDHSFQMLDDFSVEITHRNNATIDILKNVETVKFNDTEKNLPLLGSAAADKLYSGFGSDTLIGLAGNDTLLGSSGDDLLDGCEGNDMCDGGNGNDTVTFTVARAGLSVNLLKGTATSLQVKKPSGTGNDKLKNIENIVGGNYADALSGNNGANMIDGAEGEDTINGGLGADTLTGGSGADKFVFSTKATTGNEDTIIDFISGEDSLLLSSKVFSKLKKVSDLSPYFYKQSITVISAQDKDDYLVNDFESGRLFYDSDGNGSAAGILVLTVSPAINLMPNDMIII